MKDNLPHVLNVKEKDMFLDRGLLQGKAVALA